MFGKEGDDGRFETEQLWKFCATKSSVFTVFELLDYSCCFTAARSDFIISDTAAALWADGNQLQSASFIQ